MEHFVSPRGLTQDFHKKVESICTQFGVDKQVAISLLACLKHFVGYMPANYRFEDTEKARECLLPVLLEAFCGVNGFHPNQGLFVTKGGKAHCLLPDGRIGSKKATIHQWSSFYGAEDEILHLRSADGSFNWSLGKAEVWLLDEAVKFLKEDVTTKTAQRFSDVIFSGTSIPSFHSPMKAATPKVQQAEPEVVAPEPKATPTPQSSFEEVFQKLQRVIAEAESAVLRLRSERERAEARYYTIEEDIAMAQKEFEARKQQLQSQQEEIQNLITSIDKQIGEVDKFLKK